MTMSGLSWLIGVQNLHVVDQWSTSMSAWYKVVAGWERPAQLLDLGNSDGIGGIGGAPVTQAFGMDTAASKCPLWSVKS